MSPAESWHSTQRGTRIFSFDRECDRAIHDVCTDIKGSKRSRGARDDYPLIFFDRPCRYITLASSPVLRDTEYHIPSEVAVASLPTSWQLTAPSSISQLVYSSYL